MTKKVQRYRVYHWPGICHPKLAYFVAKQPTAAICVCCTRREAAVVRDALNRRRLRA